MERKLFEKILRRLEGGRLTLVEHGRVSTYGSIRAAQQILKVRQIVIPRCGHAPQIEKSRLVNRIVTRFLKEKLGSVPPDFDPARFLGLISNRAGLLTASKPKKNGI